MRMKWLIAAMLLLSATAFGQSQSQTIASSGGTVTVANPNNYTAASFEEIPITGSPGSASITVQGCMRGTTCDTAADTNTGTSAAIRGISFSKVYDYFLVTATYSGGTATGYTINSHVGYLPAGSASSSNATIISPVDGSGYVEVNCKTGCAGGNANGQATMANSAPVVIASNQSAVAQNITQVAGSTLSKTNPVQTQPSDGTNQITAAISAYGTPPTGTEVEGVNAYVTNVPAVSQSGTWNVRNQDGSGNNLTSNSTTQSRSLDANIVSALGATMSKTNPLFANIADGTNSLTSALSAWGTAPTGTEVMGVNAELMSGTNAISQNQTTQSHSLDVNLVSLLGATHSKTNPLFANLSDGTNSMAACVSAIGVAPTGTECLGANSFLLGHAGATVDGAAGSTGPTNTLQVGGEYKSAAPTPSTGQLLYLEMDPAGDVMTRNYRRSQIVAQATTIASSASATTVLSAQAASTYADIANFGITVTPAASTAIQFTATLSDGTASYIFDCDTGVTAATGGYTGGCVEKNFNPPLPATSAATAWTVALSVATVTVHITVTAIKQLAN
jgi:hypothetical protein